MRFYEFNTPLMETSRGLAARKQGDRFVSNGGPDLTFEEIEFYPQSGGYKDEDEFAAAVEEAEYDYGVIVWLNKPIKGGGFGVATFDDGKGNVQNFGRFFKVIKAIHDQNKWANDGIPGYKLNTKSGAKETAGMQPSEVLTSFDNLSPGSIVKQIAEKFGPDHALTKLTSSIARGKKFPIKIPAQEGMSFEAFRDYFCEMLHPIALMKRTTSGNAADAEKQFMGGGMFSECAISFSTSKTEGLSDSILINPNGQNVKVSSKGKSGGAQASVKNLAEAVRELNDPKLLRKHKEIVNLIDKIVSAGAKESPSELGMHYKIINKNEAGLISRLPHLVEQGLTHKKVLKGGYLSKRLQKMYDERTPLKPEKVDPHAHMVAALAFVVSDHVNNKTTFGKSAADILNNAGLITVDTKAKSNKKEWILEDFVSKFPGSSITGVLFSAQKNYASTNISGNFTFAILKNGADPKIFSDVKPKGESKPKKTKPKGKIKASAGGVETTKKKSGTRNKR